MSKNILFINLGGIGDEILFLPAIISLKEEFPNAKITLALEQRSSAILELTSFIDKTIFVNKNKSGMIALLFKMWLGKYDCVISSGSNKLISVLLFLSGIKTRIGYNTGKLSEKLLTTAVQLNKSVYAVKMYHRLVSPLTSIVTTRPIFDKVELKPKQNGTILIHPGVSQKSISQGVVKTISAQEWADLINYLAKSGKKILLTGGNDDKETIKVIMENLSLDSKVEFVDTNFSLKNLAELISSVETFVCSDSAPLHIAVGVGTKTFVFFGSTDYKKLVPENSNIIPILNDFKCPIRPCLWEHRTSSCENLGCLKYDLQSVAGQILLN